MKKMIVAGLVACSLCLSAPVLAHDTHVNDKYEDEIMHPLRFAYYAVHPVGFAAEWLIGRPFQYIISRDGLRNIFGYRGINEEAAYRGIGGNEM